MIPNGAARRCRLRHPLDPPAVRIDCDRAVVRAQNPVRLDTGLEARPDGRAVATLVAEDNRSDSSGEPGGQGPTSAIRSKSPSTWRSPHEAANSDLDRRGRREADVSDQVVHVGSGSGHVTGVHGQEVELGALTERFLDGPAEGAQYLTRPPPWPVCFRTTTPGQYHMLLYAHVD